MQVFVLDISGFCIHEPQQNVKQQNTDLLYGKTVKIPIISHSTTCVKYSNGDGKIWDERDVGGV